MAQSVWDSTNSGCIICRWKCISRSFQIISNIILINLAAVSIIRFVSSSAFHHLIIRPLMTYNPTRCFSKIYSVPTRYFNKEYIVIVSFLELLFDSFHSVYFFIKYLYHFGSDFIKGE